MVVETAQLTFCDATLAAFLAVVAAQGPVRIEHPSRWVREFLTLYGLADRVTVVR